MALPWVDFVWTIKRWLSLYPTEAIANLPVEIKTASYSVAATDYYLVGNSASALTFTLLSASANTNRSFVFFNKGAGLLTLFAEDLGNIYADALSVSSLLLAQGQWARLSSDGTTWLAETNGLPLYTLVASDGSGFATSSGDQLGSANA